MSLIILVTLVLRRHGPVRHTCASVDMVSQRRYHMSQGRISTGQWKWFTVGRKMLVNAPGVLGFRNVAAPTRLVAPAALYLHAKKHAGAGLFHDFVLAIEQHRKVSYS